MPFVLILSILCDMRHWNALHAIHSASLHRSTYFPSPYSSSNCANCCRKQRNEGSARTAVISRNSNITFSLPSRSLAFALSAYVCLHHSFWLCSDVAFISYFVCGRSSSSASSCHPRRQSHSIFTRIKNIWKSHAATDNKEKKSTKQSTSNWNCEGCTAFASNHNGIIFEWKRNMRIFMCCTEIVTSCCLLHFNFVFRCFYFASLARWFCYWFRERSETNNELFTILIIKNRKIRSGWLLGVQVPYCALQ